LHRLNASKLASYHHRRQTFVIRVINYLPFLDQKLEDIRVFICRCVVDQISAFAIGLEARWVHSEKVLQNGRVRIYTS
jgi:hypothetical protein